MNCETHICQYPFPELSKKLFSRALQSRLNITHKTMLQDPKHGTGTGNESVPAKADQGTIEN